MQEYETQPLEHCAEEDRLGDWGREREYQRRREKESKKSRKQILFL